MSSVQFSINEVTVHKGTAYPFFNILRPPPFLMPLNDGNIPPKISDRSLGTWVSAKGTWVTATIYPLGTIIVDQNGNAEIVSAIAGTGTSGGTEPVWPTIPLQTIVDNTGTNQITWTMLGRVGTAHCTGTSGNWVPSFVYQQDDQFRDPNSNIQWCIIGGTSAASAATWKTGQNQITVEVGGVTWLNLGPTVAGGGTEGAFNFDMEFKGDAFKPDQSTLPVITLMTSEGASLGGEFRQVDPALMIFGVPHAQSVSGFTDAALPASAQAFTGITTGGLATIPHYCMTVLSPRPLFAIPGAARFYSGTLNKAAAGGGKSGLGFTLTKFSSWKGEWTAHEVNGWPLGARGASLYMQ
jgi:hypothetical protein